MNKGLKIRSLIAALLAMVVAYPAAPAYAAVTSYAAVGPVSSDYSVTVNGQNVPVNIWNHGFETAHYAHFAFTGAASIQITNKLGNIGSAAISPRRFNISPTVSSNKATFNLSTPSKLVVYTGGKRIFIFAEAPESTPSQSNLKPGTIRTSTQPTWFAGQIAAPLANAPLTFLSNPLRGAKMIGRGTVQFNRTQELYNLDGFRMEGPVLRNTDPNQWAFIPRYVANSVLSNIKLLTQQAGPRGPGRDGITFDKSHHVTLENSFIFAGDDSICIKAHPGRYPFGVTTSNYNDIGTPQPPSPVHDITVRNNVFISRWNTIKFGPEVDSDFYNITFENIDILEGYSGISMENLHSAQNIKFNNVRMENITGKYFMNIGYQYANKPGSIYLNNVVVDQAKGISITSYPTQKIDVYFNNLRVAGKVINSLADLRQVAGSANVNVSPLAILHFNGATGGGGGVPDKTVPSVPANLNGTAASSSQVNLTWSASTDTGGSGIGGYKVYRNGVYVNSTTTNSYTVTGLAALTTYNFTVASYDNAGNNSAQGAIKAIKTLAGGGTPPPPPPPGCPARANANIYVAASNFSGTQGCNQWSYRDSKGANLIYNSTTKQWKGSETYLLIWGNGAHPGNGADVVRRWTATAAGSIRITGNAVDVGGTIAGADGVNVSIRKGTAILWQSNLNNGNTTPVAYNVTTTVAAGNTIDFVVNKLTGNNNDSTSFNPTITFTPGGAGGGGGTPIPVVFVPPTISSPANGAVVTNKLNKVTVSWGAVSGAAGGYAVRLNNDTDNNATRDSRNNCVPHQVCINGYKGTSITMNVKSGHKYRFWIHSIDSAGKYTVASSRSFSYKFQ